MHGNHLCLCAPFAPIMHVSCSPALNVGPTPGTVPSNPPSPLPPAEDWQHNQQTMLLA